MPKFNKKEYVSEKSRSVKDKLNDTPPSAYEDHIPLEELKDDEIENRKKENTKNTSSTQRKEVD
ncbi:hypothetical protein [Alteribacillus iranensis]|uniref:Uncharacterized protein n=1 Tax=Alteribacillus iranensis TaxID=930128 RepID=A0A1I1Z8D3_9BACI|nr:hypothetical protein [Alteribacillus iranensis]SFE27965.1 hypothetical protein SAMN05192532_10196 [Alteribacillus iranensis]